MDIVVVQPARANELRRTAMDLGLSWRLLLAIQTLRVPQHQFWVRRRDALWSGFETFECSDVHGYQEMTSEKPCCFDCAAHYQGSLSEDRGFHVCAAAGYMDDRCLRCRTLLREGYGEVCSDCRRDCNLYARLERQILYPQGVLCTWTAERQQARQRHYYQRSRGV